MLESQPSSPRRRRWLLWVGLAALLVVAVDRLPTVIARHLLAAELEDLGFTVEGLATLDVEIIGGEFSMGPLRLRTKEGAPAGVTLLDLDVGLRGLLDDHVVLEDLTLRGIDLLVRRDAAGVVTINAYAIDLAEGEGSLRDTVRELLGGRDLGVDRLEIHDSQLRYETAAGGHVAVGIDRLTLGGLRSWQPEAAATFEVDASVNDVKIAWSGEIRPFADEPDLAVDSKVEGLEFERIEAFTGAWEVARRAASASFSGRHEARLLESGSLTGRTQGRLTVAGLDLGGEAGQTISARRVEADVDVRHDLDPQWRWRLDGRVGLDAADLVLAAPRQARLSFRSLGIAMEELEAGSEADGSLSVRWLSNIEAEEGRLSGSLRISVGVLINLMRAMQYLTEMARPGETGLEVWAGREVTTPRSEVEVARLSIRDWNLDYRGGTGALALTLDTVVEAAGVRVRSRRQRTAFETLSLELRDVALRSAERAVALDGDISVRATAISGVREIGRADIEALEADFERVALRSEDTTISGTLASRVALRGVHGEAVGRAEGPPANFDIAAAEARVDEASASASPGSARWGLRGAIESGRATLDIGHGLLSTASVERAEVRDVRIDESLHLQADAVIVTGSEFAATRSFLTGMLTGEMPAGGEPAETVSSVEAGARPDRALVEDVQWQLAELDYDPGPLDGLVGPQTVAAVKAFQEARGMTADGKLTAALLAALKAAAEPLTPTVAEAIGPKPTLEIGRLVAVDGARVHFSDDVVTPDVDTHVTFDTLSMSNLNSRDAASFAQFRVSAAINEFSQIEIEGQVTPFKQPPDVELELRLTGLEVSPYSPYTASLAGLTLEEGVLSVHTTGRTAGGNIDGVIEIDARRLQVQTESEEAAQRIADTIGVQPDTAMSLLKDAEGRIELRIPVSGTLDEPDLDVDQAVNRAIGGVLAAIFPPNIIASMFSGGDDVDFEPVVFEPASMALNAAAVEYLERIATLMAEHPDVAIVLCGRSVAKDMSPLAAALSTKLGVTVSPFADDGATPERRVASHAGALAVDRARAVRRYLVAERGADPAAISECRSEFHPQDQAQPRVDIGL